MLEMVHEKSPGKGPNIVQMAGERRATDRVVRLWKKAGDKRTILNSLDETSLWQHCFFLVVDDELACSIIIDRGTKAAKGLTLEKRRVKPLHHLPVELAQRIHRLALECREECAPGLDVCELGELKNIPVRRYRMALMPLNNPLAQDKPLADGIHPPINVTNMLGVFTYQ